MNHCEHGTFLTLNHAHTSMFGVFGLLALGLIYFSLRYIHGERPAFSETLGLWAFWLYNGGLGSVDCAELLPIGWPRLEAVYKHGLAYARSQASTTRQCSGSGCDCPATSCSLWEHC